ncbi:MAG: ATP-dependent Clp protease adaptor ClpS [Phycisphaeraceae bacterium]
MSNHETADSATTTKPAKPKAGTDTKPDKELHKLPPYNVLLHNDDHNDMRYVVLTILDLTPLKEFEAMRRMFEAHQRGLALLLTTHKERAELYRDQFKAKGLTVTIEPA